MCAGRILCKEHTDAARIRQVEPSVTDIVSHYCYTAIIGGLKLFSSHSHITPVFRIDV